ncbi:MAG: LiaF-related protein [Bacteroidota bacterium]|nr:LiaF-related protein [Bacteroidota bacterium]
MTSLEDQFKDDDNFNNWAKNQRRGRIIAGLFVIGAAVLFFMREAGALIPNWVFTWPMLLIVVGLVSGIKHQFKNIKWLIPVGIGGVFLAADIFPELRIVRYEIPLILLIIGLVMIFKPKNKYHHFSKYKYSKHRFNNGETWNVGANDASNNSSDDYIFINNVFGGVKRNIISKDFKGGEIKNTFGGCELNLIQAQITNEAVLTINEQFGGIEIIVPSNWVIKSDISCMFGGVEDERAPMNMTALSDRKTLVLRGNVLFGGVEIISH